MTFPKGRSGNPAGRERGSKNLVTRALASVSEADAEAIVRKGLELARDGNPTLLKWCLHHIAPTRTSRATLFDRAPVLELEHIEPALAAVNATFLSGEITPEERTSAERVLQIAREVLERRELSRRLRNSKTV